jgi:ABC-type polysaccharide/polyol phosphate export permease
MNALANPIQGIGDVSTFVLRSLLRYRRRPDAFLAVVLQPIIVLLLFRFIFGGIVTIPGLSYVDFLIPGVLAMAVVTGSTTNAIGLAEDLNSGTVDHVRALPVIRASFLLGHTTNDFIRNLLVLPVLYLLALAVSFTPTVNVGDLALSYALLLLLGLAFAWISTVMALAFNNLEVTQAMVVMLSLLASFASSGFATVESMPSWLQGVISASPVTYVVDAVRGLLTTADEPVAHSVLMSCIWIVGIIVVAVPLAAWFQARGGDG